MKPLEQRVRELEEALKEVVDAGWWEHEDEDCPEDNTCECPLIKKINEALRP